MGGLAQVGTFLTQAAEAVGNCGVQDVGHILSNTAAQLGANTTATDLGAVVQALVSGSDVTLDVAKVVADLKAGQWLSLGHDLGALSTWLNSVQCTTMVCKVAPSIPSFLVVMPPATFLYLGSFGAVPPVPSIPAALASACIRPSKSLPTQTLTLSSSIQPIGSHVFPAETMAI